MVFILAEKLKQCRQDSKLTQTQVANALGISDRALRKYETGEISPPLDKIKQLSLLYSVPVAYLVSESDTEIDSIKEWLNTLNKTDLTAISEYIEQLNKDK